MNTHVSNETSDFFKEAAAHFSPEAFAEALEAVADIPALEADAIPERKVAESRATYKTRRKS